MDFLPCIAFLIPLRPIFFIIALPYAILSTPSEFSFLSLWRTLRFTARAAPEDLISPPSPRGFAFRYVLCVSRLEALTSFSAIVMTHLLIAKANRLDAVAVSDGHHRLFSRVAWRHLHRIQLCQTDSFESVLLCFRQAHRLNLRVFLATFLGCLLCCLPAFVSFLFLRVVAAYSLSDNAAIAFFGR